MRKKIKKTMLTLLSSLILSGIFCTSAFAAVITPSRTEITVPKGTDTFSFDVILQADKDFAGAEFGLLPSSSDVTLEKISFSDSLTGESTVNTVKDGCLYFGFFAGTNKFKAGEYTVASVTYRYTGTAARTVRLAESKIVTIDESTNKTSGDTTSDPFTVTVRRSDNSGGGGSTGTDKYAVSTENTIGGTIQADPVSASSGETIRLTLIPETGYEPDKITVTDSAGNSVDLTGSGSSYSFTMPAASVTVKATFQKVTDPDTKELPFTDVTSEVWYEDAVKYVYENGLMSGTTDTLFRPDSTTTRGMIVTVLHRLEGKPSSAASSFTDVKLDQYYAEAVSWAASNNIVNGYDNSRFGPDDPITREQMASILYRYAAYKGYDTTAPDNLSGFTDAAQISSYAKTAMQWANEKGLVTGVGSSTLQPKGNATRAQIATILMRFCENIAK